MEIRHGAVYLGGVKATDLAREYGTPLFVIEEERIRQNYHRILAGITYRPFIVHYACKANPSAQILRILHEEGACLDAGSPGDVYLALRSGFKADQIIYTGYAVSDDELRYVVDVGVFINIDSLSQIDRYGRLNPGARIGLRINPGVSAGFHAHVAAGDPQSKMGIHPDDLIEAEKIAYSHNLTIACLHIHLGSDILDPTPFVKGLDVLVALSTHFAQLESLDLGGGWGVPLDPSDSQFDWQHFDRELTLRMNDLTSRRRNSLAVRIEPGSYLVADAVSLLTEVTDVKPCRPNRPQGATAFVGTDSSMNHLLPAALYGAYHRVFVADRATESAHTRVNVCGNLLQAGDVLAKDRLMPLVKEGDILVFSTVGAYTSCRGSRFNERPLPAEVVVDGGTTRLARKRETLEELMLGQII